MPTAVREQVRSALDLVVQIARVSGARRQVVAVEEVVADGSLAETPRTRALVEGGVVVAQPLRPARTWKAVTGR